ncbi:MAG: UbiA family prenyltransferase, partial [Candidatus Hermodarchaeota archaeon]
MLKKIRNILNLLRVRQFYKNGLIFVGLFFSESLLDFSLYPKLILGFILLCCASSINYIINDIRDIEKDKRHPEKLKSRPLASGEISIAFAILIMLVLAGIIGFTLLFYIHNWNFAIMLLLIFVTGQVYNHIFKNYAFVDILTLSLIY